MTVLKTGITVKESVLKAKFDAYLRQFEKQIHEKIKE